MRLKHLTIFFAVLAAGFLPGTAHAQDFEYDSYGVYDPNSNEISGYSRTVDYMGYGVDLEADAYLLAPDEETVDSSSDDETGEAEADVYCIPNQSGDYEIEGSHYYDWGGWNWLGDSYYDVPDPWWPDPAGETSAFVFWDSSGGNTGGIFNMTLLGHGPNGAMEQGESYNGQTVQEYISGYWDGCYFDGSTYPQMTLSDTWWSSWTVCFGGYGYDGIRVDEGWVNYCAPFNYYCSESATQSMYVQGHTSPYAVHGAGVGLYEMESGTAMPFSWRDNATGFDW